MPKNDAVRLKHMLDATREALGFVRGRSREDLQRDRMLALALVKSIEIVGEAAARVTPETQLRYPGIPWLDVVAMRNRLIHAYYDVDLDRVWDTIIEDLPKLLTELERAVNK